MKLLLNLLILPSILLVISCGKKTDSAQNEREQILSVKNTPIKVLIKNLPYYQELIIEGRSYKLNPSKYIILKDRNNVYIQNRENQDTIFHVTLDESSNLAYKPKYEFNIDVAKSYEINVFLKNTDLGRPLLFAYKGKKKYVRDSYEFLNEFMQGFFAPSSKHSIESGIHYFESLSSIKSMSSQFLDIDLSNDRLDKDLIKSLIDESFDHLLDQNIMLKEVDRGFNHASYKEVTSIDAKNTTQFDFNMKKEIMKINDDYTKISYKISHKDDKHFFINNYINITSLDYCILNNFDGTIGFKSKYDHYKTKDWYIGEVILRNDVYQKCKDIKMVNNEIYLFDKNIDSVKIPSIF